MVAGGRGISGGGAITATLLKIPWEKERQHESDDAVGTRWTVLVAGCNGYYNYRHQADVCHAYQLLRSRELKEEDKVVFVYDDIAYSREEPRKRCHYKPAEGR